MNARNNSEAFYFQGHPTTRPQGSEKNQQKDEQKD